MKNKSFLNVYCVRKLSGTLLKDNLIGFCTVVLFCILFSTIGV